MTITVKHKFVSAIPDEADATVVRPSNWNDTHDIVGLGTSASLDAGVANGVATLDSSGTVPLSQIPALGDLNYQGTWNATTNSPTLTSSVGTKGFYYVVSVAGTTSLNGITDWQIGDWAVFNGSVWQKIDNTDAVTSVNGYTGTVVLTAADVSAVPYTGATGAVDLNAKTLVNIANLGVNTTTVPTIKIRAVGDNNSTSRIAMRGYSSDANSSAIRVSKFRGSVAAPQAPLSGDSLGKFELAGYGTTSSEGYPQSSLEGVATENWGATARGAKAVIKVTPNTTTTQVTALTIDQNSAATFASSVAATSFSGSGSSLTGVVTSVATSGTVNGLTLTGGPITGSGTVTLGGTLDLSSPPTIGNTSANTGAFTTLKASGNTLLAQSYDQGTGVLQVTGQSTFNGAVTDKSLNLQGGNNLVLNSATLVTQNITVTANTYTLSMTGTGTITLSGTSSGTLVGTGASQVVSKTFTPTAGTLTLTPTGSCTTVQLELGSVFSGYTATTGTAITTTNNISVPSGQVIVAGGTKTAPAYSFSGGIAGGLYGRASGFFTITNGAVETGQIGGNGSSFLGYLALGTGAGNGGDLSTAAADTFLYRDAANTLAQRNSTNAQTFRLYGTYTDSSNYERLQFDYGTSNAGMYTIGSTNAGTGSVRNLVIQASNNLRLIGGSQLSLWAGGVQQLTLVSNQLFPTSDNVLDLGSGNRFKNAYFSGVVNTGQISTTGYTVATLPTGVVGMRAYVTNALAPAYGVAVAGGGAVTIPVFYNGTAWICA